MLTREGRDVDYYCQQGDVRRRISLKGRNECGTKDIFEKRSVCLWREGEGGRCVMD